MTGKLRLLRLSINCKTRVKGAVGSIWTTDREKEFPMAVTYYVALPFIRAGDGTAPGEAQECQSEGAAVRRAEGMSRDPAHAGAVAFKRTGDPNAANSGMTKGTLWLAS
jgi:hypothetical protein